MLQYELTTNRSNWFNCRVASLLKNTYLPQPSLLKLYPKIKKGKLVIYMAIIRACMKSGLSLKMPTEHKTTPPPLYFN